MARKCAFCNWSISVFEKRLHKRCCCVWVCFQSPYLDIYFSKCPFHSGLVAAVTQLTDIVCNSSHVITPPVCFLGGAGKETGCKYEETKRFIP